MGRETGKKEVGMVARVKEFEKTKENPGGGSTDVGDVSWNTPVIRLRVATAPAGVPWHSWAVVACSGMSIGQKGMMFASKSLALSMIDFFENEELRNEIRKEFKERKKDHIYKAIVKEGPPPIPQSK